MAPCWSGEWSDPTELPRWPSGAFAFRLAVAETRRADTAAGCALRRVAQREVVAARGRGGGLRARRARRGQNEENAGSELRKASGRDRIRVHGAHQAAGARHARRFICCVSGSGARRRFETIGVRLIADTTSTSCDPHRSSEVRFCAPRRRHEKDAKTTGRRSSHALARALRNQRITDVITFTSTSPGWPGSPRSSPRRPSCRTCRCS